MLYNIICITVFKKCVFLEVDLSYRNDLNAYREERKKIKKIAVNAAKITVIVLAVLIVATTVMVIVDMTSSDAGYTAVGGEGGGSASGTPSITVPTADGKLYVYVGETVSWRALVTVSEGCTLSVDNSQVNIDKTGSYIVKYTATNGAGRSTTLEVTVVVTKKEYTYSLMETTFKNKAASLGITSDMSKKEIVLAVYDFVNDPSEKYGDNANIKYVNESNSDRDDWENDWIEEAIRTINSGEGDCYSYYSVSKAFFTVLGIEHIGIERDPSANESGTHFWMMVNIGDSNNAQWYYYDATRLAGSFSDGTNNGCLMTLAKIQSYVTSKGGTEFYKFDPTEYHTAATTKVN